MLGADYCPRWANNSSMPGKNVAVKQKNGSQRPIVSRCTQHGVLPILEPCRDIGGCRITHEAMLQTRLVPLRLSCETMMARLKNHLITFFE
jgi:hypothetical protein